MARETNSRLDTVGLLAKVFKKPLYKPTVRLPPDMYNAMWNSASAGKVPWIAGLEPFVMGVDLPALRGK
eukprot:9371342-Pyramimonas_sp.AAC.1